MITIKPGSEDKPEPTGISCQFLNSEIDNTLYCKTCCKVFWNSQVQPCDSYIEYHERQHKLYEKGIRNAYYKAQRS